MDLATAERLASATDPKALASLKNRGNDPVAAKAIAGQFAAFLMQNVMQGGDGGVMPIAGDGVGGNIVSGLFASAVSQTAASGEKLGLADMLFHSIEAKQQAAIAGNGRNQASGKNAAAARIDRQEAHGNRPADGLSLKPYWRGNGLRPLASIVENKPPVPPTAVAGVSQAPIAGHWPAAVSSPAPIATNGSTMSASLTNDALPRSSEPNGRALSFAQQIRPALVEAGRQLGVSPRILLAHAALETGWGRSVVGNNLFGIKAGASWQGAAVTTLTHEEEDGERVSRMAGFRAYPSLDASVQDYVALIGGSSRYQSLIGLGDDVGAYARALIAGGYATDTDYGRKLEAVAGRRCRRVWDTN